MVDFQELKSRITFEAVITKLALQLKQIGNQWRGKCPCSDSERTIVVTEGKGFYCFGAKTGGDQISLVAHVRNCSVKEAAEWLSGTVPESDGGAQPNKKLEPLSYLEYAHEAVMAVGFSAAFATKYGIGFARKGMMRGSVAIPFRDETGALLGYIGIMETATLPKDFT
jgi:DNA primase